MMSKLTSAIIGIGLAVIPVTVAQAQLGGLGDAASDAVKKQVVEGVEVKAGLGTPVATVVTSPTVAASPTVVSPSPAASPSATGPGSVGAASPVAAEDGMGKMLMDQAGKKAMDEAGKKMGPKIP
jgi:hypothetical protein